MTIHTAGELADAADAELKAIAAARTELRQAPECRPRHLPLQQDHLRLLGRRPAREARPDYTGVSAP